MGNLYGDEFGSVACDCDAVMLVVVLFDCDCWMLYMWCTCASVYPKYSFVKNSSSFSDHCFQPFAEFLDMLTVKHDPEHI